MSDELEDYVARDFPQQIVERWQARAQAELSEHWKVHIRPIGPDGQVFYTATAEEYVEGVTQQITLSSVSQDHLVMHAKTFDEYWVSISGS